MRADTELTYRERILRVLVYVQEHLDEVLPLDDLARLAHFSPYHFHRIFTAMVGESVKEYVRRLRLERAAHRLKFGDQPVTRVAFDAGFETHESFTRAFRAMFGVAPSRYRRAHRGPRPAPSAVHYRPDGRLDEFEPVKRGGPPMDVRIEKVAAMKVAFIRHVGPYREVGAAWERLMAWAGPRGLLGPQTRYLGIGYDDPAVTPQEKLRYDACITVNRPLQPDGEVGVEEVGGGEYAVTTHRGPYDKLAETYLRLYGDWFPKSGREPAERPGFAVYHNFPPETAPEDLLTDIYAPLKPA